MKVLITGTSRGIGRACALEYLDKGHEVTPLNEDPNHTLDAQTGKSYNVYMAGAWSNDFIVQPLVDLPEHLNFRVYILDNSGWDDVCLYMYGDKNDLGGAWPGIPVLMKSEICPLASRIAGPAT